MADNQPLCFVLMPFGTKKDPAGGPDIDFNSIYTQAIKPAIVDAGLEPIRADEERTGGIIHGAMFERLLLCDYAVADLTTANANVFYELGVRHAARPATTLPVFAAGHMPPFDVNYLRALPYQLAEANQFGEKEAATFRANLVERLKELREVASSNPTPDSPIFQLLKGYQAPDVAHLETDLFREKARYSEAVKERLAEARTKRDLEDVKKLEAELGPLHEVEVGVIVDLVLTYRALKAWREMIRLYKALPSTMARIALLKQQYGFALNRDEQRPLALKVLTEVRDDYGATSETWGLIARVHKDRYSDAVGKNDRFVARGALDAAIEGYMKGFEADSRDSYPGVNYVTLLDVKGDADSLARKTHVLPVVRFAVEQSLKGKNPTYWDYATLVELAVLEDDQAEAENELGNALAMQPEGWALETTLNNLRLIQSGRRNRGVSQDWLDQLISELQRRTASPATD